MRAVERPVSEQAASWLAILSDEACTKDERREFALWLVRANTHVDEFLRVSTIAQRLRGSQAWPGADVDRLLAEARLEASVRILHPESAELPPRVNRLASSTGMRSLAMAAMLGLIALAVLFSWRPDWAQPGHVYETRLGELRSVALDDGSIVELNAKSRIRARFSAQERHIELLDGEAVFRVARSPDRPFRVSAPFADIVAIGTQFNVDARANKTIVTVLEGRVKVLQQSGTGAALPVLGAGEQAEIRRERATMQSARVDPIRVTGWTARRLYFEDTPIAEAVGAFERYSAKHIRIEDPKLAGRRITGTFDAADPAALVQFLARYGDTRVQESKEGWRLSPAEAQAARP